VFAQPVFNCQSSFKIFASPESLFPTWNRNHLSASQLSRQKSRILQTPVAACVRRRHRDRCLPVQKRGAGLSTPTAAEGAPLPITLEEQILIGGKVHLNCPCPGPAVRAVVNDPTVAYSFWQRPVRHPSTEGRDAKISCAALVVRRPSGRADLRGAEF
jgi:hypothetical protein